MSSPPIATVEPKAAAELGVNLGEAMSKTFWLDLMTSMEEFSAMTIAESEVVARERGWDDEENTAGLLHG